MKKFLFILLFLPIVVSAQDRIVKVDRFTGDSTISTKTQPLGIMKNDKGKSVFGTDVSFMLARFPKYKSTTLYLSFTPLSVIGIEDGAEVSIKLVNGEVLTFKNEKKFKAYTPSESASVYFTLNEDAILKLKSQGISAIRIPTTKYAHDYQVDEKRQLLVSKALSAL